MSATRYDPTHVDRVRVSTCESCGHDAPHRNLPSDWTVDADDYLVEVRHPDYDPSEWHCNLPDCSCVVRR